MDAITLLRSMSRRAHLAGAPAAPVFPAFFNDALFLARHNHQAILSAVSDERCANGAVDHLAWNLWIPEMSRRIARAGYPAWIDAYIAFGQAMFGQVACHFPKQRLCVSQELLFAACRLFAVRRDVCAISAIGFQLLPFFLCHVIILSERSRQSLRK